MTEENQEMSDEEAIMKIAAAMKDNVPGQEEKQNIHVFLNNIVQTENVSKIVKVANLKDGTDKNDIDELGVPEWNVRGALEMALISDEIIENDYFKDYFEKQAAITSGTSLSRKGFLIRQGTTNTKQVADITKRQTKTKGFLGKEKVEETGGDTTS